MTVRSLAYIVVQTRDIEAWRSFGERVIGAVRSPESSDSRLLLRIDDRPWRFRIEQGEEERFVCAGLECATEQDFVERIAILRDSGIEVVEVSAADARERHVRALARCKDPAGNALELCWGNTVAGTPFVSPAGVTRFVTGEMGMGHVVLPTTRYEETCRFYKEQLGFGDSDEMRISLPSGPESGLGLSFLHASGPRHHTVAIAEFPAPSGLIHAMVEVDSFDQVGLALDRALAAGVHISATLGRHTNDKMISFYMRTPSGFDIEYGWGGVQYKDWSTVTPTFTIKEDLWGHKWDFGG